LAKIVKFYKDGCTPCAMVDNMLKNSGVEYESIHAFDNPEKSVEFGITSVPTTFLLDDEGNVIQKLVGYNPDELQQMIDKLK
jgi:glutaredoxin